MRRRGFLGALGAIAGALTLRPKEAVKAMTVPGLPPEAASGIGGVQTAITSMVAMPARTWPTNMNISQELLDDDIVWRRIFDDEVKKLEMEMGL
jgi:hypothetical protein